MPICEKCGNEFIRLELQEHHIIPKAIINNMKYKIKPTIPNKMLICPECHDKIHHKFMPGKFWWKKLEDMTLKMRKVEKMDSLIVQMKTIQLVD